MFDPLISQSQQFWSNWGEFWQERLETAASHQRRETERATQMLDEAATLTKTSVERTATLVGQWQTMGLEAWSRGVEMMRTPTPKPAES